MDSYGSTPARVFTLVKHVKSTDPRSDSAEKSGASRMLGLSPGFPGEGHACPVSISLLERTVEVA